MHDRNSDVQGKKRCDTNRFTLLSNKGLVFSFFLTVFKKIEVG